MALTTNTQTQSGGVVNHSVGQIVTDGGAAADTAIVLGFVPRYIQFVNQTDRIMLEWYEGMASNSAIRTVAAGTRTLDVTNGIAVCLPSSGALTFTVKATDIPASKVFSWRAVG